MSGIFTRYTPKSTENSVMPFSEPTSNTNPHLVAAKKVVNLRGSTIRLFPTIKPSLGDHPLNTYGNKPTSASALTSSTARWSIYSVSAATHFLKWSNLTRPSTLWILWRGRSSKSMCSQGSLQITPEPIAQIGGETSCWRGERFADKLRQYISILTLRPSQRFNSPNWTTIV